MKSSANDYSSFKEFFSLILLPLEVQVPFRPIIVVNLFNVMLAGKI